MFLRQLSKLTSMLDSLVPQACCVHVPRFYYVSNVEVTRSFSTDSLPAVEIISALEAKKDLIKGCHIVSALENIFKLHQLNETEEGRHFSRKLIHILELYKNKLSGQETVNVLKMLDQQGIQKNSKIYSAMLQHILHCLNGLSLEDFCELSDIILDETIDHSLRHDLQAALEGEFLVKLSMDYNESDIKFFHHALRFISQSPQLQKKYVLTNTLMGKLCNHDRIIPLDSAVSMYILLHSLSSSKLKIKALHRVQSDLAEQAHLLTSTQVRNIVSIFPKERRNIKDFSLSFDEKFATALIRRVIDENFSHRIALFLLSGLNRWRYKSTELLEYCCTAYFGKLATDQQMNHDKLVLLHELAVARYRSLFWDEIQEFVSKSVTDLYEDREGLIQLAARLMSLGWLTNPLMEKVFDGSFNPSNLDSSSTVFCSIYRRLKMDPSYNGPLPTDSQMAALESMSQKLSLIRKNKRNPFLIHLEEGMKGLAGIQSNLTTRFYHDIDHVVAFYQDGTPAPISIKPSSGAFSDMKYIEDLMIPSDAKLVIVQLWFHSWFFRNTNEVLGDYHITVEAMELLPYPVVSIHETVWHRLPIEKRTSFLMEKIKAKLGSAN